MSLALLALALACAADPDPPATGDTAPPADTGPPSAAAPQTVPLAAPALLRRLTLDLRGTPPTLEELAAVEADPAALDGLRAALLDDPAWQLRFATLLADQLLTRTDVFNATVDDVGLEDDQEFAFERAVGDEPLMLMAAIAAQDRPWTDVVQVDWTMAAPTLLAIFDLEPISLDEAGLATPPPDGWTPARYGDGRPPGGVLMTNGLWWRYWSAPNNYNRTRAAALSRLFLCEDYLLRPISFEASSLLDAESLLAATKTDEACVGCHVTLDPLAAALFGFWWFDIYSLTEMERYHAEREWLGGYYLELEPAWFGIPMDGPADLGPLLAEDPRFLTCTVQRVGHALLRRPLADADHGAVEGWLGALQAGELRLRSLVEAVLDSDEYQAGALTDDADAAAEEQLATRRLMTPDQLARSVAALTGFHWTAEGYDQLLNDDLGYRILAGGVDGVAVTQAQEDPSITRLLVIRRLAEAAGGHVAAADLALPAARRRLLGLVEADTTPAEAAFTDQLVELHRRFLGQTPAEATLAEERALWQAVADAHGAQTAWAALVAVLIRDPAFWVY